MRCVVALVVALLPLSARAGDPCPIAFSITDVGVVDGLDRGAVLAALRSRAGWVGAAYEEAAGGVRVTEVFTNSPAELAGLRVGDVIAAVSGTRAGTLDVATQALRAARPDDAVTLDVVRGGETMRLDLVAGWRDPVFAQLTRHLAGSDCVRPILVVPDAETRRALLAALVDTKGRLRCRDAHRRLGELERSQGDVFLLRDATRVLFSHAREATTCVAATELDGDKLTGPAVQRAFDRITRRYVEHRHRLP